MYGKRCEARCCDLLSREQAYHEFQVFGQGPEAAESASAWENCCKNPGHDGFIPVSKFCMEHMPTTCKDKDWLEFIKVAADLTVRVRVLQTSPDRPADGTFSVGAGSGSVTATANGPVTGTANGFVNSTANGPVTAAANGPVTGTGFIYEVKQTPENTACNSTASSSEKSWDFNITTAAHVVFDTFEAKSTYVDLFYNEDASRRDGTMKSLRGVKVIGIKEDHDICWLQCRCTDEALANRIMSLRERLAALQDITTADTLNKEGGTDILVISHPHGQPKKVTVGKLCQRSRIGHEKRDPHEQSGYQGLEFEYSAGTCPGSSGAPILWMDDWWWGDRPKGWVFVVHSMKSDTGFNNGSGVFYL